MIGLAARLTGGHFRRHLLEAALCVVGVALGVAVAVGIEGAVSSSVASFKSAVLSVSGNATHSISSAGGTISDEQYIALARQPHDWPMTPVIERSLTAVDSENRPHRIKLLGIDPFSDAELRAAGEATPARDAEAFKRFYTEPNTVVIADELADTLEAKVGSRISLNVGSQLEPVTVVAIAQMSGPFRSQLSNLVIADLSTAQELTHQLGQIDRIDLKLTKSQEPLVRKMLPPGLELRTVSDRADQLEQMIAAYKLNLNALSLMASFIALFIVYNAMLVSLQQRLATLAVLRCLGSSRLQLASIYLLEAICFSLVGGVLGILGGWALTAELVHYVGGTINDLYASIRPPTPRLDLLIVGKGMLIALASGLMGAAVPLWQASRTPPIMGLRPSEQRTGSRRAAWIFLLIGLTAVALALVVGAIPSRSPTLGFAMALLLALGFAMLCPLATWALSALLSRAGHLLQAVPLQMAAAGVGHSLRVSGVAVAAMMLATAMNVALLTMIGSFRSAVLSWLDQRFRSDVFVAPELQVDYHVESAIDPEVIRWIDSQPETAERLLYTRRLAQFGDYTTSLISTQVRQVLAHHMLPFRAAPAADASFDPQNDVLVSEPLAGRLGLRPGQMLHLLTPSGDRSFHIFAIYFDFASERGEAMVDRDAFIRDWHDHSVNSVHVSLRDPSKVKEIVTRWAAELEPRFPVLVHDYAHIKHETARVFDRTFRVTDVLGWMAGGVAFCGLAGALLALSMSRRREYGVLAALGMSSRQTAAWVIAEGMIIAFVATVIACAAGSALAYVLAYVIQYRSFGWSIPMNLQPRLWAGALVWSIVAALLGSIYPIILLNRDPPAIGLRQE